MSTEKMREEFEAWMKRKHAGEPLSKCRAEDGYIYSVDQYMNIRVQDAWIGWQASRELSRVSARKAMFGTHTRLLNLPG